MLLIWLWRKVFGKVVKIALISLLALSVLAGAFGGQQKEAPSPAPKKATSTIANATAQPPMAAEMPERNVQPEPGITYVPVPTPAAITPAPELIPDTAPGISSTFEIYFFDVGEGDAAAVLCDGHTMLIDGGNPSSSSILYSFLSQRQIQNLDYIVCTHPDADHCGGLAGALSYAKTNMAICNVKEAEGEAFNNFLTYLAKQNTGITVPDPGDKYNLGSAEITVLGPLTESQNSSIILRIVYGNTAFVFTGDTEDREEEVLTSAWNGIGSNVLKVAHHGSSSSTTQKFLNAVAPEYAVISVGGNNNYGHPTEEVLQRLNAAGAKVLRTDIQGQIHCVSDGSKVSFDVEKNALLDTLDYAGGYENALRAAEEAAKAEQAAAEAKRAAAAEEERLRQEALSAVYLERGSQGGEVFELQQSLIALGFLSGSADGDFGQMTENAVASFQRDMGYEATGKITKEQANTLADKAANAMPAVQANTSSAVPSNNTVVDAGSDYIINTNPSSNKFHYPSCPSVKTMNESNKWYYHGTRDEIISMGYDPCGRCHP